MNNGKMLFTGKYITAHRADGRVLMGTIESVRATLKGMLVVVNGSNGFKSFYLEDLKVWNVFDNQETYDSGLVK